LANHKSALKRAKQNENRQMRNKAVKTRVRSIIKEVRLGSADAAGDATAVLNTAKSVIDKAAKKGVIHKRAAARKISRLTKLANSSAS
jgi:small subunit ribosomal protein S20